jgi:hypothetical protein
LGKQLVEQLVDDPANVAARERGRRWVILLLALLFAHTLRFSFRVLCLTA